MCRVLQCHRSVYDYNNRKDEQAALRIRIKDIAQARASYGYRRIHIMLLREGWRVNHKRVYRLYKMEGLMMRSKRPRRRVSACRRMVRATASYPNESWSMDFMSDALYDGQKIKLLTLVDNYTRESLVIEVAYRLGGHGVELDFIHPGKPTDNALIEAFNGRFRHECLNESWFLSLDDAREKVKEWRKYYNLERPHGSLGNVPPVEFAGVLMPK